MLGMSRQEMFDKMVNHLLIQKKKSMDKFGVCVYRGPNGLKCAIGALIPDELYRREMDSDSGYPIEKVYRLFPELKIYKKDLPFLTKMQAIHDSGYWKSGIGFVDIEALKEVARKHKLDIPQTLQNYE